MRFLMAACFLILLAEGAYSQTINYTYQASVVGGLQDINVKGDIVAEINLKALLLTHKKKNMTPVTFGCLGPVDLDDTQVRRINNRGDIAGTCVNKLRPDPTAQVIGFIRERLGGVTFINPPGSVNTEVYGLNDRGDTVGQWAIPNIPDQSAFTRLHGFLKRGQNYTTIDIPLTNAVTLLAGVNRKQKILVNYFFFDPVTNEMGQWNAALYDNGFFTPLSVSGAAWTYAVDINNDDMILLDSSIGNYVQDDGIYFKVGNPLIPPGYTVSVDANGINDDGELVGLYVATETCGQPFCKRIVVDFVATPQ